jgi:hypothetical protein
MTPRRLEDRIRELCARALYAKDPEWSTVIVQLQGAIREHVLRLENLTAAATVGRKPELVRERRDR